MDPSDSSVPCSSAGIPSEPAPALPPERRASGQIEFLRDRLVVSFGDGPANGPSVPDPHDQPPKKRIDAAAYCIAALRHSTSSEFEVQVQGTVKSFSAAVIIREPALRKLPVLWDMFEVRPKAYEPEALQYFAILLYRATLMHECMCTCVHLVRDADHDCS